MHNGEIAGFPRIKRKLQVGLSDEIFNSVKGNTGEWHMKEKMFLPLLILLCQIRNGLLPCFSQKYVCHFVIQGTS